MKTFFKTISKFLNYKVDFTDDITIRIKHLLILFVALWLAKVVLSIFKKAITKRLQNEDKNKFDTIFSFGKWFLYILIFLIILNSVGVNLTALFASAAALLIGIGLALQTWFQDIMTGIFIILDKSLQIGDIIEIEGKVGRVQEIRLRTTRAITIDNKVLVIPNHLYLTRTLYNWTQNGMTTRENITLGVAFGSDVQLVKKILLQVANEHPDVMKIPEPIVVFEDFGDSALQFKLTFTLKDSFKQQFTQSDMRFRIDELFREHQISIPFPQRDIHIIEKKS